MVKPNVSHERECPLCKKHFYYYPEWVYKYRSKIFCSWKCMRQAEQDRKRPPQMDERKRQISEMLKDNKPIPEIAKTMGLEVRTIYYWRERLLKEGLL